ncbi:flagellar motor switch protein FliG [Bacillus cereus group sp. Bc002]|uniref:flagellar motor switch protein FliG n=1 Tax=Bacillus cereus group sp. Bc002 TaxID=3018130 RepID=UPI0022E2A4B5|nr:flagellar motor switch protein FliG [Bacillus cereus group sp. Bc002]MDA2778843.1 flagellar motor switch protein FliG [Bacillus cereus group sp. Bc002]HDR7251786.1 flagellar motor switch protein FliG [Bacillus pacificus]
MDKRLLSMLNELQYSDEEIARLEKEADETINIDKYYVKNGELLKKLTVQMLEESVRKDLQEGEEIECEILVEEGSLVNSKVIPNILTAGAAFYYYIVLTNTRLRIKSLDCYFKEINEYNVLISSIQAVSRHKKMKNVYGITIDNNYIQLGSKEYNQELTLLIEKLKKCGVKEERYKEFEKRWMIFFNVFVIAIGGLLVLKYLI